MKSRSALAGRSRSTGIFRMVRLGWRRQLALEIVPH
jgi:hypothetical protein